MKRVEEYFATARERYLIKLKRDAGNPGPWTKDPIFREWRFCNVHREDDRTTKWFKENIRSQLGGQKVIEATFIFRWFNRIETAEKILDLILKKWNSDKAQERLKDVRPVVTGAYMMRTPEGMNKLDGVLYCIDKGLTKLRDGRTLEWGSSLEQAWTDLLSLYGLGPFMSYELVSDLRWTGVLKHAIDIESWANAGPGCAKGLGRVLGEDRKHFNRHADQTEMNQLMMELLKLSKDQRYWPFPDKPWEMREVEHWSCEFEKYCRAQDGHRLKRRFE